VNALSVCLLLTLGFPLMKLDQGLMILLKRVLFRFLAASQRVQDTSGAREGRPVLIVGRLDLHSCEELAENV